MIMGELSLDGVLRPIKGALPIAIQARRERFRGLIVPEARCNYGSPDNSGNFVTIGQDWFIDIADKSVGIVFPFD